MLADGSNPEGVDPEPALGWKKKSDLKDVVVATMPYSPPCLKVLLHLRYAGVPYELMTAKELRAGKSPEAYIKCPVLFNAGRQVNDSYVILKHLVPALYPASGFSLFRKAPAATVEEWEQKLTFGLQLAMEVEAFEDKGDYPAIVTFGGLPSFMGTWLWWMLPLPKFARNIRARRAKRDEQFGPLLSAKEYCDEFRAALGSSPFLGGESQPGPTDVSMYATLVGWETLPSVQRLVDGSDLQAWYARMKTLMPVVDPAAM